MSGALVTSVDPDSPAARASLVPGDIVTGISGEDLPDARAIQRAIIKSIRTRRSLCRYGIMGNGKTYRFAASLGPTLKSCKARSSPVRRVSLRR